MIARAAASKGKHHRREETQQSNEQGVKGMDDEDVERTGGLPYPIEHEHRLCGEVPRACTVGCWHKNGEDADDKGNEGNHRTKACSEVETVEREVEVQEVAHPNAYRIEHKEHWAFHFPNRKQAFLQVREH